MKAGNHLITSKCSCCGDCVPACPTASIFFGVTHYVIDRDTCSDCGICLKVCPVDAIKREDPEPSDNDETTTEYEED